MQKGYVLQNLLYDLKQLLREGGGGGGLGCYPRQLPYATAEFVQYSVHNVSLFVIYRGVNPSVTDNYVFPVDFPDKKVCCMGRSMSFCTHSGGGQSGL